MYKEAVKGKASTNQNENRQKCPKNFSGELDILQFWAVAESLNVKHREGKRISRRTISNLMCLRIKQRFDVGAVFAEPMKAASGIANWQDVHPDAERLRAIADGDAREWADIAEIPSPSHRDVTI